MLSNGNVKSLAHDESTNEMHVVTRAYLESCGEHWSKSFKVYRLEKVCKRDTRQQCTLMDYIHALLRDTDNKNKVRFHSARAERDTAKTYKSELPAWILCNDTGLNEGHPNGLIQLDLDHVDDVEGVKRALAFLPFVLAVYASPSGQGVNALYYSIDRLNAPDDATATAIAEDIANRIDIYLNYLGFEYGDFLKDGQRAQKHDNSCDKPCQSRYESFDDTVLLRDELVSYEDTMLKAYDRSALREIAGNFRTEPRCGGIETGAALALCGLFGESYSRYFNVSDDFRASAQVVLIGESGEGKTGILKTLKDLNSERYIGIERSAHEGVLCAQGTTAGLREQLKLAGTKEVNAPDSDEKHPTKIREPINETELPKPVLFCVDEAGDRNTNAKRDDMRSGLFPLLREAFGGRFTTDSLRDERAMSLRCRLTVVYGSTVDQYARSTAGEDKKSGNARRLLEFYQPSQKTTNVRELLDRAARAAISKENYNKLKTYAENLVRTVLTTGECFMTEAARITYTADSENIAAILQAWVMADYDKAGLAPNDFLTLVFNTATLCAAARTAVHYDDTFDCHSEKPITLDDLLTTREILLEVAKTRSLLYKQEMVYKESKLRSAGEITKCLLESLQDGRKRYSQFTRKGAEWKNAILYLTDEHIIRRYTETQKLKSGKDAKVIYIELEDETRADELLADDVARLEMDKKAREFKRENGQAMKVQPSQRSEGKLTIDERCERYIGKVEIDHSQNDNTLRSIAGKLKANASLMEHETEVKNWFWGLMKRSEFDTDKKNPYSPDDCERLWRDGNLKQVAR